MAYLNETHPELFYTPPRPGGIVNIDISNDLRDSPTKSNTTKGSMKSFRSTKSIKSTRWTPSDRNATISAVSSRFTQDINFNSTPDQTTRDYRIHAALDSSPWILFDHNYGEEKPRSSKLLQDTIDILAIAVSTIMLLAAGYDDIPITYLRWAKSYLQNIKDEHGNNPPNVTGILNCIQMLQPTLVSFNTNDECDVED